MKTPPIAMDDKVMRMIDLAAKYHLKILSPAEEIELRDRLRESDTNVIFFQDTIDFLEKLDMNCDYIEMKKIEDGKDQAWGKLCKKIRDIPGV